MSFLAWRCCWDYFIPPTKGKPRLIEITDDDELLVDYYAHNGVTVYILIT